MGPSPNADSGELYSGSMGVLGSFSLGKRKHLFGVLSMLNPDGISQGNVFKRAPEAVESLPGQGSGCPQEDRLS